jgi:hypothetical protein
VSLSSGDACSGAVETSNQYRGTLQRMKAGLGTKALRALSFLIVLGLWFRMLEAAQSTFVVRGPTVIAFFWPLSKQDIEDGESETLSDFQYYSGAARARLTDAGISFHEVYDRSFRVRLGTRVTTFRFEKRQLGYYFIAPGKKPRVEYGVETDLEALAADYFGFAVK